MSEYAQRAGNDGCHVVTVSVTVLKHNNVYVKNIQVTRSSEHFQRVVTFA